MERQLDSKIMLSVEREDDAYKGNFVARPLWVYLFNEDGSRKDVYSDYYPLLDRIGPKIMVSTGLGDGDKARLAGTHFLSSIVEADAPWNAENLLIVMNPEDRSLDLTQKGKRLHMPFDVLPSRPQGVYFELGRGLNDKMVRVVLEKL